MVRECTGSRRLEDGNRGEVLGRTVKEIGIGQEQKAHLRFELA